MAENDSLAKSFQEYRAHLRALAHRMLGSSGEADDALQEAWLRLSRSDASAITNLGGWLTTAVARVCLDLLRSRTARREESLGVLPRASQEKTPEAEVALADALGPALLVVLESLAPAERVAFVLHDMFDLSFEEIAPIIDRSPVAARQLASRGRRKVRGSSASKTAVAERQGELVQAFISASREGNFEALLAVLAPEVVLEADELAVSTAAANNWGGGARLLGQMHGAAAVAEVFKGRRGTRYAFINGDAGLVWAMGGETKAAFLFTVEAHQITSIRLWMEPAHLQELEVELAPE